jgi:predicted transcriptional regulator
VKKTTLYLEPDVDRALGRVAESRGVTKAEVIRTALRDVARGLERPRIRAIGLTHGPGDVADNVDEHLAETGFGSE